MFAHSRQCMHSAVDGVGLRTPSTTCGARRRHPNAIDDVRTSSNAKSLRPSTAFARIQTRANASARTLFYWCQTGVSRCFEWHSYVIFIMNFNIRRLTRIAVVGGRPWNSMFRRWSSRTGPCTGEREVLLSTLHSETNVGFMLGI